MKKKNVSVTILVILIILCLLPLIIWTFRLDRFGFSNQKWIDFIKYDGILYESEKIDQITRVAISVEFIGEKIGEVKFKIDGNVHSPYYILRNFDATVLEKGTAFYEIIDEKYTDSYAVKIDNEYFIYTYIPRD